MDGSLSNCADTTVASGNAIDVAVNGTDLYYAMYDSNGQDIYHCTLNPSVGSISNCQISDGSGLNTPSSSDILAIGIE